MSYTVCTFHWKIKQQQCNSNANIFKILKMVTFEQLFYFVFSLKESICVKDHLICKIQGCDKFNIITTGCVKLVHIFFLHTSLIHSILLYFISAKVQISFCLPPSTLVGCIVCQVLQTPMISTLAIWKKGSIFFCVIKQLDRLTTPCMAAINTRTETVVFTVAPQLEGTCPQGEETSPFTVMEGHTHVTPYILVWGAIGFNFKSPLTVM